MPLLCVICRGLDIFNNCSRLFPHKSGSRACQIAAIAGAAIPVPCHIVNSFEDRVDEIYDVRSSNVLEWLDLNMGHQNISPIIDRQDDMPYWLASVISDIFLLCAVLLTTAKTAFSNLRSTRYSTASSAHSTDVRSHVAPFTNMD